MMSREYSGGEVIAGRVPKGEDLLQWITRLCEEKMVESGVLSFIGAVSSASLLFYDQARKEYLPLAPVTEPMEIVSGSGNVSLRDGKPFVHAHIILSSRDGVCIGGHLSTGATVFACEFSIIRLEGSALVREHDEETGLWLWRI